MEGKELKKRREALGITQSALANILDVKPNTVTRWENGVLPISKTVELALETVERKHEGKNETLKENPASGLEREN